MPKQPIKADSAYRVIRERIERNDYRNTPFPSERKLAVQLGVSHPTARKAVQQAIKEGLLRHSDTGRLLVCAGSVTTKQLQLAIITPIERSPWIWDWINGLRVVAAQRDARLRIYHYLDETDAHLMEALNAGYDLGFLVAPNRVNPLLGDKLNALRSRLVSIFSDLRAHGVPWLDNSPLEGMDLLVQHLHQLGHKRIACVTCETPDMLPRIARYRQAMEQLQLPAIEAREDVPADWLSSQRGYRFMARELTERSLNATALVFTTIEPAFGALRACHEAKCRLGVDLSICAFGPSHRARLMVPALTALQTPTHETVLADAIDKMLLGGELALEARWPVSVFVGESTGNCRGKK